MMRVAVSVALLGWLVLVAVGMSQCAPLVIAGGVELEHDAWCHDHKDDVHCKGW